MPTVVDVTVILPVATVHVGWATATVGATGASITFNVPEPEPEQVFVL